MRKPAAHLAVFLELALRGLLLLCALLAVAASAHASERLSAHNLLVAGDASRARMVLHFDKEPSIAWFLLSRPHRLVLDLPSTGFAVKAEDAAGRGLVKEVHFGDFGPGVSRLILTADGPFAVDSLETIKNENSPGWRLVLDISATSQKAFDNARADQALTTASTRSTPKTDRVGADKAAPLAKPFTVVIDPGHGGIDSGAEGVSGTLEKRITLEFARELKAKLEKSSKYAVVLTRDGDTFLRLDERVRIARQHSADLFISIHADTIKYRSVTGATVYTVSDQASDAEAAALAARENLSDELAGLSIEDKDHEVSDILMDLIRRETHSFSIRFARTLVGELTSQVEMIKNPHRFAGFRVLRAPDVPSVLLELGYLSNPDEEKRLLNAEWRAKAIESITGAINLFSGLQAGASR